MALLNRAAFELLRWILAVRRPSNRAPETLVLLTRGWQGMRSPAATSANSWQHWCQDGFPRPSPKEMGQLPSHSFIPVTPVFVWAVGRLRNVLERAQLCQAVVGMPFSFCFQSHVLASHLVAQARHLCHLIRFHAIARAGLANLSTARWRSFPAEKYFAVKMGRRGIKCLICAARPFRVTVLLFFLSPCSGKEA